jgi:glycosyltransferase involved in cell wall biosynthesis
VPRAITTGQHLLAGLTLPARQRLEESGPSILSGEGLSWACGPAFWRKCFVTRDLVIDLDGDCCSLGYAASAINASTENLDSDIVALLQLFQNQSWPIRSIILVGCSSLFGENGNEAALLELDCDSHGVRKTGTRFPVPPSYDEGARAHSLEGVARRARDFCGECAGEDLLLIPADILESIMPPSVDSLGFTAVAALAPPASTKLRNGKAWRLQRTLFDHGLVGIGSAQVGRMEARCFLMSQAVRYPNRVKMSARGQITMSTLGRNGAFANQLFQYAYVKLYALRHGLMAAVPEWEGRALFGLEDPTCAGHELPQLRFSAFTDDDRSLWGDDDPPIDLDLWGYFQEIPECWRKHREFLRRIFSLSIEHQNSINAWRNDLTRGGQRTLVALHLRRGDYRVKNAPEFRLVPENCYSEWLRTIWPKLCDPLLFVATDEPEAILPRFKEFELVSPTVDSPVKHIPEHIRDFEMLRRADYLAICNSSFSRMAAILAPSSQNCFIPSSQMDCFEPYEPWIDPSFWARFTVQPTIYFEISDLLLYLLDHPTLSGIQRVQCEILRHLVDHRVFPIRFLTLIDEHQLGLVDVAALLEILDHFRSVATTRADIHLKVRSLLDRAVPCSIKPRDIFLTIGAFWAVKRMGTLLQRLKNSGVSIGLFIHDILPITHPEYFGNRETKVFVKAAVEALTFADFVLTASEYNKTSLASLRAAHQQKPLPVNIVRLANELSPPLADSDISDVVARILETDYVLCVGTIEVRKNPSYLFNIWKLMVQSGRANIPTLVFAGRKGWLLHDFLEQLKACNYLDGRIVLLHNVTDKELDELYRRCLLTIFPSYDEGWGLPVGESLAYGKVTICSEAGGIPEVGGTLVDYVDPYNARNGLQQVVRYLDDTELRYRREDEIRRQFAPRSWRNVTDDLLRSVEALAREVQFDGVAAITLPPNRFLPISSDSSAIPMDGVDGGLSADLACISGWRPPEPWGAYAEERTATFRFRAAAEVGSKIHLVMRLAACGQEGCHIRVSSWSGAEATLFLKGGEDSLAVLSCEVEPDSLVTVRLSLIDNTEGQAPPYWTLRGILYLQSERLARDIASQSAHLSSTGGLKDPTGPQAWHGERVQLAVATPLQEGRRAASFEVFLRSRDSYWPTGDFPTHRKPPIFVDPSDSHLFHTRYRNAQIAPVGDFVEHIMLVRRSHQYVSMSRFSEGTVFDRSGVFRAFGYVQAALADTPWLSTDGDRLWVAEAALAAAPYYNKPYLVFYNGNLHNYYHWLVEGILSLEILTHVIGPAQNLNIALPISMDINAMFDHRETLRALGFGALPTVEVSANLINVREAIWVETDELIEQVPAPYLKNFQQRIGAKYAGAGRQRNRRLLIGRKIPTRRIHNFEQIRALLSSYGFETIFLEGLSIVEQIQLFQSAEFVIGAHGAGLTNLLFCEAGTKVIEFMPCVEMRPFFWLISEKLNLIHGMQFCPGLHGETFQADLYVDPAKLERLYRVLENVPTTQIQGSTAALPDRVTPSPVS